MGNDSDDILVYLIGGILLFVLLIAMIFLVVLFVALVIIGFLTLRAWAFDTDWGRKNEKFTSLSLNDGNWNDLIIPSFVWGTIGLIAFIPTGGVIIALRSLFRTEDILVEPYSSISVPIILLILTFTILGPLPFRIGLKYRKRNSVFFESSFLDVTDFAKKSNDSSFSSSKKVSDISILSHKDDHMVPDFPETMSDRPVLLTPFYCQICGTKHPSGIPRFQCEECGRFICLNAFNNMASVGRTCCPMCDGKLIAQ